MRKLAIAMALASTVLASPAAAVDGAPYVGIEGGILFPKDQDADLFVDYTTTQTPATPVVVGPADTTFDDTFGLDYKMGYDIDALVGYDFGMFRLEGEIGYKRSKLNDLEIDSTDLAALNTALNGTGSSPLTSVATTVTGVLPPGAPGSGTDERQTLTIGAPTSGRFFNDENEALASGRPLIASDPQPAAARALFV